MNNIQLQANSIDFGNIKSGVAAKKIFKVTNRGDKEMKLTDLGRSCSCTTVQASSNTMQPGASIVFDVTLTPSSTGIIKRSFWFTIDNIHRYTIDLRGNAY